MKSSNSFIEYIVQMLIQAAYRLDSEVFCSLKPYQGNILLLDILDFKRSVYFIVRKDKIEASTSLKENQSHDAHIKGKLIDLIKIALTKNGVNSQVEISGDMDFAQAFQHVFKHFQVDWQEIMAYCIGDTLAYTLGNALQSNIQGTSQYLTQESKMLPLQIEMETFYHNVDGCRHTIERLYKRYDRLLESQEEN